MPSLSHLCKRADHRRRSRLEVAALERLAGLLHKNKRGARNRIPDRFLGMDLDQMLDAIKNEIISKAASKPRRHHAQADRRSTTASGTTNETTKPQQPIIPRRPAPLRLKRPTATPALSPTHLDLKQDPPALRSASAPTPTASSPPATINGDVVNETATPPAPPQRPYDPPLRPYLRPDFNSAAEKVTKAQ
jgi:hypothetical protein